MGDTTVRPTPLSPETERALREALAAVDARDPGAARAAEAEIARIESEIAERRAIENFRRSMTALTERVTERAAGRFADRAPNPTTAPMATGGDGAVVVGTEE